jgi:hypothetical protein
MARPVLPRVHMLAICDEIEGRWEGDSLYALLGVRTQLTAPMFPHVCPQLCVYAQVTGHEGTSVCQVLVERGEDDEDIAWTAGQEVQFSGPRDFIPLRFSIIDCEFPAAGVYYIQILFDGKLCSERAFDVIDGGGAGDE